MVGLRERVDNTRIKQIATAGMKLVLDKRRPGLLVTDMDNGPALRSHDRAFNIRRNPSSSVTCGLHDISAPARSIANALRGTSTERGC